jgi:hypothetical protein
MTMAKKGKTAEELWVEYQSKSKECERAFALANQLEREAKSIWRKWQKLTS